MLIAVFFVRLMFHIYAILGFGKKRGQASSTEK